VKRSKKRFFRSTSKRSKAKNVDFNMLWKEIKRKNAVLISLWFEATNSKQKEVNKNFTLDLVSLRFALSEKFCWQNWHTLGAPGVRTVRPVGPVFYIHVRIYLYLVLSSIHGHDHLLAH
jgi:hypothetical protein